MRPHLRKQGILLLLLAMTSSLMGGVAWADEENTTHLAASPDQLTIMQPDRETLERWVEDYNSAPPANVDSEAEGLQASTFTVAHSVLSLLEYDPGTRDQGSCGNCWAWAGTGCLGVALNVQEGTRDRLSVQYINSCQDGEIGKDCCDGGNLSDFADFYTTTGKAIPWDNSNAA